MISRFKRFCSVLIALMTLALCILAGPRANAADAPTTALPPAGPVLQQQAIVARDVANGFLNAIALAEWLRAYDMFSPQMRATYSLEKFLKFADPLYRGGMKTATWQKAKMSLPPVGKASDAGVADYRQTAELPAVITAANGDVADMMFLLVMVDGVWKIEKFRVKGRGVNKPETPATAAR